MAVTIPARDRQFPGWLEPVGRIGQGVTTLFLYLGGLFVLGASAWSSLLRPRTGLHRTQAEQATMRELWWMLSAGFPIVGLIHVGIGSFLSMQAYFGSTFVDGTGAVVGVGLVRNLASLLTGLTLAGMLSVRIVGAPGRTSGRSPSGSDLSPPRAGRGSPVASPPFASGTVSGGEAAAQLLAAAIACPLLSLWGAAVGTIVGWQTSGTLMGLSSELFFLMLLRMLWFRDVLGILVKGVIFGTTIATVCCHERSRRFAAVESAAKCPTAEDPPSPDGPIRRAACVSMTFVLLTNMTWFLLVYHAVPIYGPSLLAPPGP